MKAGVSIGDLSPKEGIDLGGYPYFYRHNTGIHDPIFGSCLYLEDDDGANILLLASDLFYLTRRQADELRERIELETGHPQDRIIVTCSHTHSAPWMSVMFESFPGQPEYHTQVDADYIAFVISEYTRLAALAISNPFEAEIAFAQPICGVELGIGGNRRDPVNGPTDPDLPIMVIRDKEETVRAIHTKYALHPTILHGENTLVSADYPGAVRAFLRECYPHAVFMFSQGTSGDQSPRYFRRDQSFAEVKRFGGIIGGVIHEALEDLKYTAVLSLRYAYKDMDLTQKTYDSPQAAQARVEALQQKEDELKFAKAPYAQIQTANLWTLGAECEYYNAVKQEKGLLRQAYLDSAPYTAHVLVLNFWAYVFLPGEIFSQFGLRIKADSPYEHTQIIALANGDLPGYIVTHQALADGGYEPGNSTLDPTSGDIMAATALDLLKEIKSK